MTLRAGGGLGSMVSGISATQPDRQHHPTALDVERLGRLVRQYAARCVVRHCQDIQAAPLHGNPSSANTRVPTCMRFDTDEPEPEILIGDSMMCENLKVLVNDQ